MVNNGVLDRAHIVTIVGACMNEYEEQRSIVPAWKRGISNRITAGYGGEYDGGDRVIGS